AREVVFAELLGPAVGAGHVADRAGLGGRVEVRAVLAGVRQLVLPEVGGMDGVLLDRTGEALRRPGGALLGWHGPGLAPFRDGGKEDLAPGALPLYTRRGEEIRMSLLQSARNLQSWLDEYSVSHRDRRNI